jgi:hypothetical protein
MVPVTLMHLVCEIILLSVDTGPEPLLQAQKVTFLAQQTAFQAILRKARSHRQYESG